MLSSACFLRYFRSQHRPGAGAPRWVVVLIPLIIVESSQRSTPKCQHQSVLFQHEDLLSVSESVRARLCQRAYMLAQATTNSGGRATARGGTRCRWGNSQGAGRGANSCAVVVRKGTHVLCRNELCVVGFLAVCFICSVECG